MTIGDAFHNLRASLDHLIWQLVESNGNTPTQKNAFPIGADEPEYKSLAKRYLDGVAPAAVSAIDLLTPWRRANDALWLLHHLNICDKHRLLLSLSGANTAVSIDFGKRLSTMFPGLGAVPSMRIGIRPADRDVADGTVVFIEKLSDPGGSFEPQAHFDFELALPNGDREALGTVLTRLHDAADRAISKLGGHLV